MFGVEGYRAGVREKYASRFYGLGLRVLDMEAVSYLRLIDSCITQLKAQGPSRTCNECKEEEKRRFGGVPGWGR